MAVRRKTQKTVYVGLSGGVDSSVSAALLKAHGHNVVGVFIRTWQPDFIECTWRDERRDAMRVAAHLGIPFRELNLETEYKKYVADYMIQEYTRGRTPNPDVMCNREIKFGAFKTWALAEGADFVATGHYAQIHTSKDGTQTLAVSRDADKDQTYFLWTLNSEDLRHILFPIGHLTKTAVRLLAKKYGLATARKKDSQGICMLGAVDMKDFLKEYIKPVKGHVLNENGDVVGTHPGALFFTLGERHGFTITEKAHIGSIFYVVAKDSTTNTITVSAHPEKSIFAEARHECLIENVNLTIPLPIGSHVTARARYRAPLVPCTIIAHNKQKMTVRFDTPDFTISAGQSLVFYLGKQCLGGGIIA